MVGLVGVQKGSSMRIDVVGRNLEVTDPIREYAVSKVDKLNRFYDRIQLVNVTVSKEDRHTHGAFGAEVRIDVEKHADFVAHASNADLYAAIDEAVQKVTRQLHEHKEKTKPGPHR